MSTSRLANAALLRIVIETLVFGMAVVLMFQSLRRLYVSDQCRTHRRIVFFGQITLLLIGIAHLAVDIIYIQQGFDRVILYLDFETSSALDVIEQCSRVIGVTLANVLMTWRLWKIWKSRVSLAVLPLLSVIGTLVCGIGFVLTQALLRPKTSTHFFKSPVVDWTVAYLACSFAASFYCTSFVIHKQLRIHSSDEDEEKHSKFSTALCLSLESGALYTSINTISLALYLFQSNAVIIVFALQIPSAVLSLSLIILYSRPDPLETESTTLTLPQPHYQTKNTTVLNTTMWPQLLTFGSQASIHSKPSVYSKKSAPLSRRV